MTDFIFTNVSYLNYNTRLAKVFETCIMNMISLLIHLVSAWNFYCWQFYEQVDPSSVIFVDD